MLSGGRENVSIHARHFCRAIRASQSQRPTSHRFQSTPGISAGRYGRRRRRPRRGTGFQSTPGISAGRYVGSRWSDPESGAVSIHARHFCRAIPPDLIEIVVQQNVSIHARHFCRAIHLNPNGERKHVDCFNPRPAFLPGDTRLGRITGVHNHVSIHARHFCRAIPLSGPI